VSKADEVASKFAGMQVNAMAIQLRSVVGHHWGWYSNEEQRMHIQTLDAGAKEGPKAAKIWLESNGKRVFEVSQPGDLSAKDLKVLESRVTAARGVLEDNWAVFMIKHGWVSASVKGRILTVTGYPRSNHPIVRKVDLSEWLPGAYPHWDAKIPQVDFDRDTGLIQVGTAPKVDGRDSLVLKDLLWQ
jgi:hypothetical protein